MELDLEASKFMPWYPGSGETTLARDGFCSIKAPFATPNPGSPSAHAVILGNPAFLTVPTLVLPCKNLSVKLGKLKVVEPSPLPYVVPITANN